MSTMNKTAAARYCGVSVETLDRYRQAGKIAYLKIGDRILFRQNQLDDFLDSCVIRATMPLTSREVWELYKASEASTESSA